MRVRLKRFQITDTEKSPKNSTISWWFLQNPKNHHKASKLLRKKRIYLKKLKTKVEEINNKLPYIRYYPEFDKALEKERRVFWNKGKLVESFIPPDIWNPSPCWSLRSDDVLGLSSLSAFVERQLEFAIAHDSREVQIEEVRVEHRLNDSEHAGSRVKETFHVESIDPVGDVECAVDTE